MNPEQSSAISAIASAISALATIILVGVTAWYAYLTKRLSQTSQEQAKQIETQMRFPVIQAILEQLLMVKRYCMATVGGFTGSDLAPTVESLPRGVPKSALLVKDKFDWSIGFNTIFLPESSKQAVQGVSNQLSLLASAELMFASEEDIVLDDGTKISYVESISSACNNLLEKVNFAVEQLQKDSGLLFWGEE